ncbi:MAG: recombinase family protein [Campylobacterales bacterium]
MTLVLTFIVNRAKIPVMTIALLRSASKLVSAKEQEEVILTYAVANNLVIERYATENSPVKKKLEDRPKLLDFLQSLTGGETLIIYDFWVLSRRIDELVKTLSCMMSKSVTLHLAKRALILRASDPAGALLGLLAELREEVRQEAPSVGRPKGSTSGSQFDNSRAEIIKRLCEGESVTRIAQALGVPRSSLNDYIVSRNLKEIAAKLASNQHSDPTAMPLSDSTEQECPLEDVLTQHNLKKGEA